MGKKISFILRGTTYYIILLPPVAALGLFYVQGQGGSSGDQGDDETGLTWLKKSSASGSIHGTGLLALQYYTKKLFSKAAETAFK